MRNDTRVFTSTVESLKALAAVIICQACHDVQNWERLFARSAAADDQPNDRTKRDRRGIISHARRAVAWLRGQHGPGGLTFVEFAELLGADPDLAQQRILDGFDQTALQALDNLPVEAKPAKVWRVRREQLPMPAQTAGDAQRGQGEILANTISPQSMQWMGRSTSRLTQVNNAASDIQKTICTNA